MPFRVSRPEGVLVRELSGEAVILNLETESYFGLDEMGARMWAALMGSPSVDEAQRMLLEEFAVDPGELRADLTAFIDELAAAGLVRVDEA